MPKDNKDISISSNYRPIALSSCFSKVLERSFLITNHCSPPVVYSLVSSQGLQLHYALLLLKNVVSRYINNGSPVLGCFLDASKAFDLVDHDILFRILLKRGLPLVLLKFLLSWYSTQKMQVRWDTFLSEPFSVSNGVQPQCGTPFDTEKGSSCLLFYWL